MIRGQTWVEFIITTAVFLFVIAFLFVYAAGQARNEIEKTQSQTSCIKSTGLENILEQPGEPADWETGSSAAIFGLGNSSGNAVSLAKWLKANELGFVKMSANATPESPWLISYKIYAFEPDTDAYCKLGDGVTICRRTEALNITASSSTQSTTKLVLFFPFSLATTAGSTLEPDDNATLSAENGTKLSLLMHTNNTDEDFIDVSFAPNPELVFIGYIQIDSAQNLAFSIGNTSAIDSFGAPTTRQRNLCTTKVKKLIDFGGEIALADFELQTW